MERTPSLGLRLAEASCEKCGIDEAVRRIRSSCWLSNDQLVLVHILGDLEQGGFGVLSAGGGQQAGAVRVFSGSLCILSAGVIDAVE